MFGSSSKENLHTRVCEILEIATALHARRPDLQDAFELDDPEGIARYWYWLHWQGLLDEFCDEAPRLRDLAWPRPPAHLTGRVVGEESDETSFSQGGLVDWRRIRACLVTGGFDFERGGRLLDFGVGCGRIIRYFALYGATCTFAGCDVDAEAVAWCRSALDFATFASHEADPPTTFENGSFDGVYGFSVFSHLPEDRHLAWLEELHRITRPGATVVLTTMGVHCAQVVAEGKREHPHPDPAVMEEHLPRLEAGEFLFFPYRQLSFQHRQNEAHFSEWDLQQYGTTYLSEAYIRRRWSDWFDVVAFDPAADDWQDYVVLKRRS